MFLKCKVCDIVVEAVYQHPVFERLSEDRSLLGKSFCRPCNKLVDDDTECYTGDKQ